MHPDDLHPFATGEQFRAYVLSQGKGPVFMSEHMIRVGLESRALFPEDEGAVWARYPIIGVDLSSGHGIQHVWMDERPIGGSMAMAALASLSIGHMQNEAPRYAYRAAQKPKAKKLKKYKGSPSAKKAARAARRR